MGRRAFFVLLSMLLFLSSTGLAAEQVKARSAMYPTDAFQNEKYTFSPYERMYLVLDFFTIPMGEYTLSADWLTPQGKLERQTLYTFSLDGLKSSHRIFFWLQLKKRGRLKQIMRGSDFKEQFYGEWKVQVFLNGKKITEKKFKVI